MSVIYLNGTITPQTEQMFTAVLEDKISKGETSISVLINTVGGSILAGAGIFGAMRHAISRGIEITTINIGNALSMGAGLLQAGSVRKSYRFARAMIHGVQVPESMTIDENKKGMINSFKVQLIDIMSSRSKLSREEVEALLSPEKDTFMSSEELLEKGLIDEIIEEEAAMLSPQYEAAFVENLYNQLNSKTDMQNILNALNKSTEAEALAEVARLQAAEKQGANNNDALMASAKEVNRLKADLAEARKVAAHEVVSRAVEQGKIPEEKKDDAIVTATANLEAFSNMLELITTQNTVSKKESASDIAGSGDEPGGKADRSDYAIPSSRQEWTYDDWEQKDPKGLLSIAQNHPETYNNLLSTIHVGIPTIKDYI